MCVGCLRCSELIEAHNNSNEESTYTLGHNAFSHLSWDEFKETVRIEKNGLYLYNNCMIGLFMDE